MSTLSEQLSSLPIKRLTTVLRVDLPLSGGEECFKQTRSLIDTWWRGKVARHGLLADPAAISQVLANERCRAEVGWGESEFALALEEIAPSPREPRDWMTDVGLATSEDVTLLSVRLSFRQPQNFAPRPEPRAPRFLREVVELGFGFDQWPLSSSAHLVGQEEFPSFLSLLLAANRTLPVVVVSENWPSHDVCIDAESTAQFLAGAAHVVRLKGEASWLLSRELGDEWSTFKGAVRCYNPKLDIRGDKFKHRLWLAESIQRVDAGSNNGFLNACLRHVFTQLNANFEVRALLSPGTLRREQKSLSIEELPAFQGRSVEDGVPAEPFIAPDEVAPVIESQVLRAEFARHLQEQVDAAVRLAAQVEQLAESNRNLERDLQEERAAHAGTEKLRQDDRELLELYQADEIRDQEVRRLLAGDASAETSKALVPLWQAFGPFFQSLQNVSTHVRTMELELTNERARVDQLEEERGQLLGRLSATEGRLRSSGRSTEEKQSLLDLIPRLIVRNPSLIDSLHALEVCFPERIAVLKSARDSATSSAEFTHGLKAFQLLWRLATDYWQRLQSGGGDALARDVFGESYAPRESEKISKTGELRRTFHYEGQDIFMEKHLKVGVADNATDTLRVHFEWLAETRTIVIGHCGCHLDF